MSLIGRVLKSSEIIVTKNWSAICANSWNEFATLSKKIDVPLPPKRPLTAYMIFVKENRPNLAKENPDLNNKQQIKQLAQKWSQLTLESRKPFELKARENTQLYGEEHKRYYESLSDQQKEEIARQKSEKKKARQLYRIKRDLRNSNVPKSPTTAYNLFVQSFSKEKNYSKEPQAFLKEVAEKWKSISEEDRKVFEKQSEADKARYMSEFMKWRERMIKEGNEHLVKAYDSLQHKGKSLIEDVMEKKLKKSKVPKTTKSKCEVAAGKK